MAGTINLANVALGFDASKIQNGVLNSAAEFRKLGSIVRESQSPIDRYNQSISILNRANDAGALSAKRFAEAKEMLRQKFLQTDSAVASHGTNITTMIGRYASTAVALGAVKKAIVMAADMEQNVAAFTVLTGSMSKANDLMRQFVQLDRESPLSKGEFARASKTLMGFGVDADLVSSRMRNLSEISMGNSERFQQLALAFGQVTAAGKLTGQEVLQFINAGFNPLQAISEKTGKSMGELRKQMEDGQITVRMVTEAFDSATAAGGKFFGMNEKMLNTTSGQFAKLRSEIEQTATSMGDKLLPATNKVLETINRLMSNDGALGKGASAFGDAMEVMFTKSGSTLGETIGNIRETIDKQQMRNVKGNEFDYMIKNRLTPEQTQKLQQEQALKRQEEQFEKQRQADLAKTNEERRMKDEERAQKERDRIADRKDREDEQLMNKRQREFEERFDKMNKLRDESKKINEDAGKDVKDGIAPALKAGSVEAYKFTMSQKSKADEVSMKQLKVQEDLRKLQKETVEAVKRIPALGLAG